MKLHYFLAIWLLCYNGLVRAEIYKRVDADGHITYSNAPLKGAKKLHLQPLPTIPPRTHANGSAADLLQVDATTQKNRDHTRKQILGDELASEEKALAEARQNLQTGSENPEVYTDSSGVTYRNVSNQNEKMKSLREQVLLHEKNIAALKTELSK